MSIVFNKRAENSLTSIIDFISEEGYPDTAEQFLFRIEQFISTLKNFPKKFARCKQVSLKKKGFRCVPFEKNYIIVYKPLNKDIIVYNIIHSSKFR
jgi:plasmid stabilization system protein ParE